MNTDLKGAIMFAVSAICMFLAFGWMGYALILDSATSGIGMLGLATMALVAGAFSGGVLTWVSYRCYRLYKKNQDNQELPKILGFEDMEGHA